MTSTPTSGEPRRFFFVHMQKTAGTALLIRLQRQFGGAAVYPAPVDEGPRIDVVLNPHFLAERFAARKDEIRLVTGHFPLCVSEMLGVPFETFTVLRDPVERTLSFLRHHKKLEASSRDLSLEEIYEDPVLQQGLIRNHMVKMLSLTTDEMTHWAMTEVTFDDARLARAEDNLERRIDVFGLQERFEEFCDDLTDRFGWDLGDPAFANRTEPTDVSEEFRARIAADNAMDMELYAFADRVLQRRHASAPGSR